MYFSNLNPGFNYSSVPYAISDIPRMWFSMLDNLPEKERKSRLEQLVISPLAVILHDKQENRTVAAECMISVNRRYFCVNSEAEGEKYYTFYDRPFDAETIFEKDDEGDLYAVITLNHSKPHGQQLTLVKYLNSQTNIEGYNAMVTLLAYGDQLLQSGYDFADSPKPLYCDPFEKEATLFNANINSRFLFKNVECVSYGTNGSIKHKSISDIINYRNYRGQTEFLDGEQMLRFIHQVVDQSVEDDMLIDSWEEDLFLTLGSLGVLSFVPHGEFITTSYGRKDCFSFHELFACQRIGGVPAENRIVLFGNNHFQRFEFKMNSENDYLVFGNILMALKQLYLSLHKQLVIETGCFEKDKSGIETTFFMIQGEEQDEEIFIDLSKKGQTEQQMISSPAFGNTLQQSSDNSKQMLENSNAMEELNGLIGLDQIKQDVAELSSLVKLNAMRKEKGLPTVPVSLHLVFTGNPGTGKTTVARIIGKIYKDIGVLSQGQLIEVDRAGLVAGYVGQTALKTQEKIEEAIGGILFIDEAYTLAKDGNDFGQEAIDTILKAMEDHRDDLVVIVAGYPDLMETFINSNPGLRSRFNKYLFFADYKKEELESIFDSMCSKYHLKMLPEAKTKVYKKIGQLVTDKRESFANAREIRNLFEDIITNQATRIATMISPTEEELLEILPEDIK